MPQNRCVGRHRWGAGSLFGPTGQWPFVIALFSGGQDKSSPITENLNRAQRCHMGSTGFFMDPSLVVGCPCDLPHGGKPGKTDIGTHVADLFGFDSRASFA